MSAINRTWRNWVRRFSFGRGVPRSRLLDGRLALLEMLEDRRLLNSYIVNTTADSGPGSLRQAILDANGNSGPDVIDFGIGVGGPQTIVPLSPLPAITDPLTLDGTTQTGFIGMPLIQINGDLAGAGVDGLTITAGNSTVHALAINGFSGNGLVLSTAGNNVIIGNCIGTDVTGDVAVPNTGDGILVSSADNIIGGTAAGAGNVISANGDIGVLINGAAGTTIQGNLIGTDSTGTLVLGNTHQGVMIRGGASGTLVGGNTAAARNVISGNAFDGVAIYDAGTAGNTVQGNYIGTDITGLNPLGNTNVGVSIMLGAANSSIGGSGPGEGNLISGNGWYGVWIDGSGTAGNQVMGNLIGTDATGEAALANHASGVMIGNQASSNVIGGTAAGAGNVISGNDSGGVGIFDAGTTANLVQGNYIGTDATGLSALGNTGDGLTINSSGNTIGGVSPGSRNIISGNAGAGVTLSGVIATSNLIQGNYIGTNALGTAALPNAFRGIYIGGGASSNVIGGAAAGARNVISGNGIGGVAMRDAGTSGNLVLGNYIGTDAAGTFAIANDWYGVEIGGGATANFIGGTAAGAGNVISGNTDGGIAVRDSASGNFIQGNYIGTNAAGTSALANSVDGIALWNGANANLIGGTTAGARNLISGNVGSGIHLANPGTTTDNLIQGNYIGTNLSGSAAIPNGANGILADGAVSDIIGGAGSAGNLISGNTLDGVYIIGGSGHTISGNYIGTNAAGTAALPNGNIGVEIFSAPSVIVGGAAGGEGNLISGNLGSGILVSGVDALNCRIFGNTIGTNVSGTAAVPNGGTGVSVSDAGGMMIGSDVAGTGNLISGNAGDGINFGGVNAVNGRIFGNRIGTDASGAAALPNGGNGVSVIDAGGMMVGGDIAGTGNLISGNVGDGVSFAGVNAVNGRILGNYIGTDASGTAALANGGNGVSIYGVSSLIMGGATTDLYNLVSGNLGNGILLSSASDNQVFGNYIGTDVSGAAAVGNAGDGISIVGGGANLIGVGGVGNLISGNIRNGIEISDSMGGGNQIESNLIGTDATGTIAIVNSVGILINGSPGNVIGGAAAGDGNLVSGNYGHGVYITGFSASGNSVLGNFIGTNRAGTAALGNGQGEGGASGIWIANAPDNIIGGTASGSRNVISGNALGGIDIVGAISTGNQILGNYIGTDTTGMAAVPNTYGMQVSAPDNIIGGAATGAGNLISGNLANGIILNAAGSSNQVLGNYIGTDASGAAALSVRQTAGIYSSNGSGNIIGGLLPAEGNLISGNVTGIYLRTAATGDQILGNYIGTDASGSSPVPNSGHGIWLDDAVAGNNVVQQNTIAWNGGDGIYMSASATNTGNLFSRNSIHDNVSGISLGAGANNNQAFPTISSVSLINSQLVIQGTLSSTPNSSFTIEFFANPAPDPSGYGQGQSYLTSTLVTTDGSGVASFSVAVDPSLVPFGSDVTATATDVSNSTSEFSASVADTNLYVTAGSDISSVPGQGTGNLIVATIADAKLAAAAGFSAMIDWGDGLSPTPGVIIDLGGGNYQVQAAHVYASSGDYTVTVSVDHTDGRSGQATLQASVVGTDIALTVHPQVVQIGQDLSGLELATFTDPVGGGTSDYNVTINWGDGSPLSNDFAIVSEGAGVFGISASHVYSSFGQYNLSITVNHQDGRSASGSATITAADQGFIFTPSVVQAISGEGLNNVLLCTFEDALGSSTVYTATIDWGDGSSSDSGSVVRGDGLASVFGSHVYNASYIRVFPLRITISTDDERTVTFQEQAVVFPAGFDAAANFSSTDNPSGTWSYGWMDAIDSTFTLYTDKGPDNSLSLGGLDSWVGLAGTDGTPLVIHNGTANPITYQGTTWQSGQLSLHPGPAGEYSMVRWTAPADGQYLFSGQFLGLDDGATPSDVYVLQNGSSIFSDTINGSGGSASFMQVVDLTAGDTLDFAVGADAYTSDGGSASLGDTVALDARIARVDVSPLTPLTATRVAGRARVPLVNVPVALFMDPMGGSASDLSATIDWGDGTQSSGVVVSSPLAGLAYTEGSGSPAVLAVQGTHTYGTENGLGGSYIITTTIRSIDGRSITITNSAVIMAEPKGSSVCIAAVAMVPLVSVRVGVFKPAAGDTAHYSVTINWGDGHVTPATIALQPNGWYAVLGSNTYAVAGTYTITLTPRNDAGWSTTDANATATVQATGLSATGINVPAIEGSTTGAVRMAIFRDARSTLALSSWHNMPADGPPGILQVPGIIASSIRITDVQQHKVMVQGRDYSLRVLGPNSVAVYPIDRGGINGTDPKKKVLISYRVAVNTAANQYSATIVWGNGRMSAGTVSALADGSLVVRGTNVYGLAGTQKVRVTIRHADGRVVTAQSTAYILNAPMVALTPVARFSVIARQTSAAVFSFLDCNPLSRAGDFQATIDWGDGKSGSGVIQSAGRGKFNVLASHSYGKTGSYTMTVTIHDVAGYARVYRVMAVVA